MKCALVTYRGSVIIHDCPPLPTHRPPLQLMMLVLHFEPSLDALSLRSDVLSSIKILPSLQQSSGITGEAASVVGLES